MKVLITGATGFIGKALTKFLINKGLDIYVLLRSDLGEYKSQFPTVKVLNGDIETISVQDIDDNGIEIIFHLAWENVSKVMLDSHIAHFQIQRDFLEKVLKSSISKLIISGSCFEYGKIEGEVSVSSETLPNTCYGIAKNMLKDWVLNYSLNNNNNIPISWMRVFYVFGENQHERSLYSQLMNSIQQNKTEFDMSRGYQIRDFISIDDVVRTFYKEINNMREGFTLMNICSGNPISVREFVENILENNNYILKLNLGKYPIPDYEPIAFWGNNDFILNYSKELN